MQKLFRTNLVLALLALIVATGLFADDTKNGIVVSGKGSITAKGAVRPATATANQTGLSTIPYRDTIYVTTASSSNRKGLQLSRLGSFGNSGNGKISLDFSQWGDCDTSANVYVNSGSVAVGYISGADTNMFWSMNQEESLSETGLLPVLGPILSAKKNCNAQNFSLVYSGRFTTNDSNISMEKTWYAPILAGAGTVDSAWMIQALKVFNTSGASLSGVVIGEICDWDIPSDTGARNSSGIDLIHNLVFQRGFEYNDVGECQNNDARFGAIRYLGGFKNAQALSHYPSGIYTRERSIDVIPTGNFVAKDLFNNLQLTDFTVTDSVTDIYTAMSFARNQTLGVTDTLRFYTAWLTVRDGDTTALFTMSDRALAWYTAKNIAGLSDTLCVSPCFNCCMRVGNVNYVGGVNVADVTFLIKFLFISGSPAPPCRVEADLNGDGKVNIADAVYLVKFLFAFGPPPPPCPPCS